MNETTSLDGSLYLAVFGPSEFTLGFTLSGIKHIIATDGLDGEARIELLFKTLKRSELGVIIVDENALQGISAQDRLIIENSIHPVVIVISEKATDTGSLRRQITRAIGIDVYTEK